MCAYCCVLCIVFNKDMHVDVDVDVDAYVDAYRDGDGDGYIDGDVDGGGDVYKDVNEDGDDDRGKDRDGVGGRFQVNYHGAIEHAYFVHGSRVEEHGIFLPQAPNKNSNTFINLRAKMTTSTRDVVVFVNAQEPHYFSIYQSINNSFPSITSVCCWGYV